MLEARVVALVEEGHAIAIRAHLTSAPLVVRIVVLVGSDPVELKIERVRPVIGIAAAGQEGAECVI